MKFFVAVCNCIRHTSGDIMVFGLRVQWLGSRESQDGGRAMTTASILAKYIIASCSDDGKSVTNLKLQKLLYYAQAWKLALHGKPLFNDRIEAWVHGPVVPVVFREYRDFKWAPLPVDQSCPEPHNE